VDETIETAKAYGFDTLQADGDTILCGKPGTATLVQVFPNGSWEYRDVSEDEIRETDSSAATLGVWLSTLP
jgi:hypothetical protein